MLHQFSNLQTDGYYPAGELAFDQAGNLYGTTAFGGEQGDCLGFGCGTVFQLTRSGSGWVKTTLEDYNFYNGDPSILHSGVIIDRAGNLYGSSEKGGSEGNGTVYEVTRSGSGWTTTILHNFSYDGEGEPVGGLVMDDAGTFTAQPAMEARAAGAGHRPKFPTSCGIVFRGGSKPGVSSYEWMRAWGQVSPISRFAAVDDNQSNISVWTLPNQ